MTIECDVLVIGGGPAGCSAARAAAEHGLKTILIEEHPEIGEPVQCAEGIGKYLMKYMPVKIPYNLLKWEISGMYFWADGIAIKRTGKIWSGYAIDRKEWDQWLASKAIEKGVKILTKTEFQSLEFKEDYIVREVLALNNGKKITFKPRYVIGADGTNSKVLESLNVRRKDALIGYVKSFEMDNLDLLYPNYDQLFFGKFAPKAYAYIFPLSKTRANIGVGTINEKDNLEKLLDEFISIPLVERQVSRRRIIKEKSGEAPISKLSDKIVYGNVFLVGDAANQNIKPFLEGIIPSVVCGEILGNFIYRLHEGKHEPEEYEDIVNKKFNLIKKSQKYADIILKEIKREDKIFDLILLGLSGWLIPANEKKINKIIMGGYEYIRKYVLERGGFVEE